MFGNNGNSKGTGADPDSPERLNRVVEGSSVEGDLICESNLRIDGTVKGTVRTQARLVIGVNGYVEGDVLCKEGDVEGKVSGSLEASELIALKSTSRIDGDINTKKLSIEEGAVFTGKCSMGEGKSPAESRKTHEGSGVEEQGEKEDQERAG